ncbi:MAG TPA: NAD(P)-binding domain-containing protein [Candidatus Acidoferrales bacterium]|jgi:thioredoxin reductase|nr:NAD(P)-binding domain-containing protein [Candidatus Acidoferrales bacterium]
MNNTEANHCDVAVIGAGPYGLSLAAHLRAAKVNFRIFGSPMHTWAAEMPRGMRLKSDGLASSLYDPDSEFTLETYCKDNGLPYADVGIPVPLETFVAYGLEFQKRFVPQLENKSVVSLKPSNGAYVLRLEDGETVTARRVIVAVGLTYYQYVPEIFSGLPETHVTHSGKHKTLDRFKNQEVVVVGAGASALDTAALLHQGGARVRVVARVPQIRLWDPPKPAPTSFIASLRNPLSGLGRGWKLYLCAEAPLLFRLMPLQFRLEKVKRVLGPAPAWFIKKDIVGKVALHPGLSIKQVRVENGKVKLEVTNSTGAPETLEADHLIAATGYRVDLRRLPFFDAALLAQIQSVQNTPVLSSNFESSLQGLYFIGTSAANTFGPLLRFAVGAKFTARRLSRHLAKSALRNGAQQSSQTNGHLVRKEPSNYAGNIANDRV